MRYFVLAAVVALSLGACAGTGEPAITTSLAPSASSLGKTEACTEFAKARPIKMDHSYMVAFDLVIKAGSDKAKVEQATQKLMTALPEMREDFEAIAAITTDAAVKTALTGAVADIKVAEAQLPGTAGDQVKVLEILNKINLRTVDAACKP